MARTGHPVGQGTRYYRDTIIKGDLCVWCQQNKKITTDHIHPVSYGGPNHWTNYAPTCHECNQRKGNQSVLEFFINRQLPKAERVKLQPEKYVLESPEFYYQDEMWFDPFGFKNRDSDDVSLRV